MWILHHHALCFGDLLWLHVIPALGFCVYNRSHAAHSELHRSNGKYYRWSHRASQCSLCLSRLKAQPSENLWRRRLWMDFWGFCHDCRYSRDFVVFLKNRKYVLTVCYFMYSLSNQVDFHFHQMRVNIWVQMS